MAANIDKKLAKKLAKMSEEERKAFLEEQRRAEEEMKLKKEEMLSRFLKVRVQRRSSGVYYLGQYVIGDLLLSLICALL